MQRFGCFFICIFRESYKCIWFLSDISDLEVFIKPESIQDLRDLQPLFHKNENGGDVWYEGSVRLPQQTEPFQVNKFAVLNFYEDP